MQAGRSHGSAARRARQRRTRLATSGDRFDRLPDELCSRIVEHLEPIRRDPVTIVEIGSVTGRLRPHLARLYPRSHLVSCDDCPGLLRGAYPVGPWRRRVRGLVGSEVSRLPLAAASVDMLVCNLAILRARDLAATLAEWRRVMRHDAIVMLATLGPLSFNELLEAWLEVDAWPHLHPLPDMHEIGDALVRAGFSDVVIDSERLQVEFDDVGQMLREMRSIGGGNVLPARRRSLMTRRTLERLEEQYRERMPRPGCWATVEAVFAHGWVVERGGVTVALPVRAR